jgi:ABC-2 type transport system ATP-binding protein
LIEVNHLTKKYGDNTAVSDLSFSIEKGQIYGFLGPNGAGKSTTMNIMTGCLAATSGDIKIGGYDIYDKPKEAKKLIGYLPEIPPLYDGRTPREYLEFVARAKGTPKSEVAGSVENAMAACNIADVSERLIKNLSKGYKQRVGIAQAILGNPEVIILDEPTIGLDPIQIIEIRELIAKLGKEHTVILSSHILSEVQAVCGNILIISKGKMVANGTPQQLEKMFKGELELDLTVEASADEAKNIIMNACHFDVAVTKDAGDGRTDIHIKVGTDESIPRRIFFAFAKAKKPIVRMNSKTASLEDIFLELTSEQPDQPEADADGEGGDEK